MVLVLMRFFIQGDEERAYKTQQGREQKPKRVKWIQINHWNKKVYKKMSQF